MADPMTMGICPITEINNGQFTTVKDFWPDKSPWSEDLKWISLSTTMGKCPFSISEALCLFFLFVNIYYTASESE
jgi:hypothetical protein